MKVLFVTNLLDVGGIETNLVRLARELSTRGHEVLVAAKDGRLSKDIMAAGGRVVPLRGSTMAAPLDAATLRRLVSAERPDVMHAFSATASVLSWAATRFRRHRPRTVSSIMGLHASPEQRDAPVLLRCWLTALGADRLIVMAPAIDAMVRRLPLSSSRFRYGSAVGIDVPPPASPDEAARLRAELRLADGQRAVVTAGRLEPRKSHELFIRAAARILDHRDDVRFFIAGDGALQGELEAEIERLRVADDVVLLGSRSDLPALLTVADVCVRPGVVEGFIGITVLEAQATGTPVVSFDLADVRIAVEDGVTGLLVPPRDVEGLAAAVERILDDPELASRLSRDGRTFVEQRYAIAAVADWLLSVYRD